MSSMGPGEGREMERRIILGIIPAIILAMAVTMAVTMAIAMAIAMAMALVMALTLAITMVVVEATIRKAAETGNRDLMVPDLGVEIQTEMEDLAKDSQTCKMAASRGTGNV